MSKCERETHTKDTREREREEKEERVRDTVRKTTKMRGEGVERDTLGTCGPMHLRVRRCRACVKTVSSLEGTVTIKQDTAVSFGCVVNCVGAITSGLESSSSESMDYTLRDLLGKGVNYPSE